MSPIGPRRPRLPLWALLAAVGLGAWLSAAGSASAAVAFERCADPDAAEWECATHAVPLDWSGATPGTIDLEVRRYRPEGAPDPAGKPPFFALAGGPGQSATSAADLLAEAFGAALPDYQLIVYDQRGTGLSGALSCPALAGEEEQGDDPVEDQAELSRRQIARCGEQLGERRAFYTTLDSVRDIDSIRAALGAPRIGIGGVSYGTYVSALYAQQLPERTDRIVLDSVVPPDGESPFELGLFGAIPRVVIEQCEAGACLGVTPAPLGDLRRLVGEAPNANFGTILTTAMQQGDTNPALRAGQPAAFRAGAKDDGAPLLRFLRLAGAAADEQAEGASEKGGVPDEVREDSAALRVTTVCTDIDQPWPQSLPPGGERNRLFRNALAGVPVGALFPFGRPAVRGIAWASKCLRWPLTGSAPPPAHPPFPDVPTFIVNGTADLRTPEETALRTAREFAPDADLVLVEGQGHSVLPSVECARTALARFFAGETIGDPCADVDESEPVEPLAPTSLGKVERPSGTEGRPGRTLGAVLGTVEDLRWVWIVKGAEAFDAAGLRGGRGGFNEREDAFELRKLAYVPGVKLIGTLERRTRGRLVGTVRVKGGSAAHGTARFRRNGKVSARLAGERMVTRYG